MTSHSPASSPELPDLGPVYIPDDQGPEDVRYVREDRAIAAVLEAGSAAAAQATKQVPEPCRPDLIERLSYHACERDDLSIDDACDYLAKGWKHVHGRTERQLVMQILALLAAAPTGEQA